MRNIINRFRLGSLNKRLILIPSMIFIPMSAVIVYLLISINQLSVVYEDITQNITIASKYAMEFKNLIDKSAYTAVIKDNSLSYINKDSKEGLVDPYIYIEMVESKCMYLSEHATVEEGKKQAASFRTSLDSLKNCLNELEKMMSNKNISQEEKLKYLDDNIYNLTNVITDGLNSYILQETRNYKTAQTLIKQKTLRAFELAIIVSVIVGIIGIVMSYMALRSVTKPIKKLCDNINKVGKGDFTVKTKTDVVDEIAVLTDSFNDMTKEIGVLVEEIKKEQDSLRLAEIKLLQEQITPHFLYNTLDAIVWLAEDNKTKDVITMVTALSDFFRIGLSEGRDVISIKEEMEHINSYLQIQKFRYQDIMDYEIDVEERIYYYHIPKLTLQPIVENALYHGIKNKRGEGKIYVKGYLDNDNIIFEIIDNGKGMEESQLAKLSTYIKQDIDEKFYDESTSQKGGYGLVNVNRRIVYYYGNDCGLSFESKYNEGTKVMLKIKTKEIILLS